MKVWKHVVEELKKKRETEIEPKVLKRSKLIYFVRQYVSNEVR